MASAHFSSAALRQMQYSSEHKYYVYALIDPRDNQVFYVGKGCGNRVFQHANAVKFDTKIDDANSAKITRIKEIIDSKLKVESIIIRRGLTERCAFELESALMDVLQNISKLPDLTNKIKGFEPERGWVSADILNKASAPYKEPDVDYVLIKTTEAACKIAKGDLYEATRKAWKASLSRLSEKVNGAYKYKYVISVIGGVVQEVYDVSKWEDDGTGRVQFEGCVHTHEDDLSKLKGHLIPEKYRLQGAANPFMYKK